DGILSSVEKAGRRSRLILFSPRSTAGRRKGMSAPFDLTAQPSTDPTSVYRYRDGLYAVDLLTAAIIEFDFFTWLNANPSDLAAICRHFGIAPRPTDVMLTLFASMGLLARQGDGRVTLTTLGREH